MNNAGGGLRKYPRRPLVSRIRIAWEDEHGINRVSFGRTIDISPTGLGVRLDTAIPVRSYVHFEISKIGFRGSASVRFVRRQGLMNDLGLEFNGSLRWEPSKHPIE